jgi:Fur family peroxide stress response transcriptional regulator
MSRSELETRLEAAAEALRARGLPLTIQRRALLEGFLGRDDHPSAETLYREIAPRLRGLSRATVYRTLETLVAIGLAERIAHPGAEVRYDPRIERHHHLVCEACGSVADYAARALDRLPLPSPALGFEVTDYSVQFRGLCAACARPRSRRRAGRPRVRERPKSPPTQDHPTTWHSS